MNSSPFMDKQITALAGAQSGDLLDLLNQPPKDSGAASVSTSEKKEDILPSYDFQPIHRAESSPPPPAPPMNLDSGASRAWNSGESTFNSSTFRNYSSVETHESSKFMNEKAREVNDEAVIVEIDRTVKKYADNLLSALEGVSSRLSQLESRTRHLESSVDDLKLVIGNNAGSTDGKLRQLENVLREVQTGLQVMRDKQDIAEAQVQLMKLHASSGEHQDIKKPLEPAPGQQIVQQPPPPPALQQPALPVLSAPAAPVVPQQIPQQSAPPAPVAPPTPPHIPPVQYPPQVPQVQNPSVQNLPYPPPPQGQGQEHTSPNYQPMQQPPSSQSPSQHYPMPVPPYSQIPLSTPHQPAFSQNSTEASPYMPQQPAYPPSIRPTHPPNQHPTGGPPPQFYGPSSNMYEPPTNKPNPSQMPFASSYPPGGPGPGFSESHQYGGPPSHYGKSSTKPVPFAPAVPSSGSGYPRLPTAQLLPQATPVGSSSSNSSTGNRVPVDDVVEKVATMGFSRDQVRATVKKLTENGQSVDLNVVLDKLMNDGETQRGWYGR